MVTYRDPETGKIVAASEVQALCVRRANGTGTAVGTVPLYRQRRATFRRGSLALTVGAVTVLLTGWAWLAITGQTLPIVALGAAVSGWGWLVSAWAWLTTRKPARRDGRPNSQKRPFRLLAMPPAALLLLLTVIMPGVVMALAASGVGALLKVATATAVYLLAVVGVAFVAWLLTAVPDDWLLFQYVTGVTL